MDLLSRRAFLLSSAAVGLAACTPMARTGSASSGGAVARARGLYEAIFERLLAASPETATDLGLDTGARAGLKSQLSDMTEAGKLRQFRPLADALPRLRAIDRSQLRGRDRGWLDTAIWLGERAATFDSFDYGRIGGAYAYPVPYAITQLTGSYVGVPDFLDTKHTIETEADAQAYLDRLDQFARNVSAEVEGARADGARGAIPPGYIIDKSLAQTRNLRAERGTEAGLVRSLVRRTREKNIRGDWEARAVRIVDGPLAAALDRQTALLNEWRGRAGIDPATGRLPDGQRFYREALRFHTSTTLSPQEVHQIGLRQIEELNAQADPLLRAEGLTQGTVGARMTALGRVERHLFPNTDAGREELLTYVRGLVTQLRARMPELFYTIPTSGMEVRRVPPAIELGAPGGYAEGGSLDGSRPGAYYINLASTAGWPRWSLPTLTCHEAIPGHLWQGAIVLGSRDIPLLHRSLGVPAFGEGWGLYSETLGDEIGLYREDAVGHIGMLQSFLFRAVRLVVDTGMHALGWSRERAIRYFVENTGREQASSEREIDRYVVWPGQATAYKIGHNEMLRIREETRRRLGPRFDIKAFHDLVLLSGDMPLEVLAAMAREWDGSRLG
jgi:uncharacterized protein (DUF885 family)